MCESLTVRRVCGTCWHCLDMQVILIEMMIMFTIMQNMKFFFTETGLKTGNSFNYEETVLNFITVSVKSWVAKSLFVRFVSFLSVKVINSCNNDKVYFSFCGLEPGSATCLPRPACTSEHYIMYYSPCIAGEVSVVISVICVMRNHCNI